MTKFTTTICGTTFAGTLAELSAVYSRLRDESGEGASTFPTTTVRDSRNYTAGFISYNGRIWAEDPRHVRGAMTATPIYDNRLEA